MNEICSKCGAVNTIEQEAEATICYHSWMPLNQNPGYPQNLTEIWNSPLPPYTVAVYRPDPQAPHRELVAIKRIGGHWDVIGATYWLNSDEELFEQWPECEIRGEGIWPNYEGFHGTP